MVSQPASFEALSLTISVFRTSNKMAHFQSDGAILDDPGLLHRTDLPKLSYCPPCQQGAGGRRHGSVTREEMTPRMGRTISMKRAILLSAASLFTLAAASPALGQERIPRPDLASQPPITVVSADPASRCRTSRPTIPAS